MIEAICLLVLFGLATAATLGFKGLVARHIVNDVLRVVAVGIFFLGAVLGLIWLAFNFLTSPSTTLALDDTYYFTQELYGTYATSSSQGYDLTFYEERPFWLDRKLGNVQVEGSGQENIEATLKPAGPGRIQLRIAADGQERLDTTLSTALPFRFRRTPENRTIDQAQHH